MVNLIEIMDRALEGPFTLENDFDLKIFVPKLREVVKKIEIKYDPENPLSCDDDLADRVFKAGIELFAASGVYCVDTERIIKSRREKCMSSFTSSA
jgi:methylamine--corrinoid protein Co-methyltransferase